MWLRNWGIAGHNEILALLLFFSINKSSKRVKTKYIICVLCLEKGFLKIGDPVS